MPDKDRKQKAEAPDWPLRLHGAFDLTISIDLQNWVSWPKNSFQKMLEAALSEAKLREPTPSANGAKASEKSEQDISKAILELSRDIAASIYQQLPRDRFSYLIEYDQTVAAQNVLIRRIWAEAIEFAKYQYFIARDAFSYVMTHHAARLKKGRREALGSVVTRSLLVFREILALCEVGFPDGAMARWRTIYELQIILAALNEIGGEVYELYIAAERVTSLRYIEAIERRKGNYKILEGIKMQMDEIRSKHGKQIFEDYGWAAAGLNKSRVSFRDLEQIAKHDFQRAEYKFASRLIHGNHFEYISLLGYPEWSGAQGPLIGPSPYGVELVLEESVKTLTFIIMEVLSNRNTLDTAIMLQIAVENRNKFQRAASKASKMMKIHTDNINNNFGL